MFKLFDIPTRVKVLVDNKLDANIKKAIEKIGCELYQTDLASQELHDEDIRRLTDNTSGIDITYRETMDLWLDKYYDWLSYEILNERPEFCFIPFGTGDLYTNVLKIVYNEFKPGKALPDPRFRVSFDEVSKCNFFGARTNSMHSKLEKLFSHYLPSLPTHESFLDDLKERRIIGSRSAIYFVKEPFVDKAIEVAAKQKINCEPSGIAGLALLLQMGTKVPLDKKILIVNTGLTNYSPTFPPKK